MAHRHRDDQSAVLAVNERLFQLLDHDLVVGGGDPFGVYKLRKRCQIVRRVGSEHVVVLFFRTGNQVDECFKLAFKIGSRSYALKEGLLTLTQLVQIARRTVELLRC